MDNEEKIIKAIENHETLLIKMKYGLGDEIEVEFDPYIYGSDTMQYGFVWGYLPWSNLIYKILTDFIINIKSTKKKFKVQPDVIYLYAIEEEHRIRVKEMNEPDLRVWAQTAPVSGLNDTEKISE